MLRRYPFLTFVCSTLCSTGLLLSLAGAATRATPRRQSPAAASSQESSQRPPVPKGAGSTATLGVTTRLVQINVLVNDKHGNPVTGLTKEDFTLFENKIPQKVQLFSAETDLPSGPSSPPLPPDTFSNQLSARAPSSPSATLILLDALNTEFADQILARKQVLKLLQQLRPQDRVAIYWLGNNLYVLNDFTTDPYVLREALARYGGQSSRELAESNVDYLNPNNPNSSLPAGQASSREAFRSAFDQRVANQSTKDRVRLTVAALIAIAHHVGSLQGRKNLVWVSGSFPFNLGQEKFDLNWAKDTGESFSGEIERAAQALTDAGIAVYPVDARGLLGNGVTAAGDYSEAPSPEFSGEGNEHLPSRVAPGNLETMKILAERTGGKAFYGSNNLSEAIRCSIDDSRVTYTLGFYPTAAKWDGRFHTIKVKVKTRGAEVRSRTGYFALPDSAIAPPKSIEALISQTAISQLDATAIGLRAHIQSASSGDEKALNVDLHLDLHDIHMEQINGVWTSALQTVFLQLNNRGEIIQGLDETLQVSLPPALYELALKDDLKNTRYLRIVPGAAQLSIVVRDPANGNLGSLSVPIAKYLPDPSTPVRSH